MEIQKNVGILVFTFGKIVDYGSAWVLNQWRNILLFYTGTGGHLMLFYKMEIPQKSSTVVRPGVGLSEIFIRRPDVILDPK
jgi:hypothetical protein